MSELRQDQFSVDAFLLKGLKFIPFLKKNIKFIGIGVLLGGLIGFAVEIYRSNNLAHSSEIVFILDNEGSNGGGLSDIASSLGLGGFMGNSSMFSGENFKELLKTRSLYRKALLTEVEIDGKKDLFANFFLKKCDLAEHEWSDLPPDFINYRFKIKDISQANIQDKNILNTIYNYLNGKTSIDIENPKSSFQTLTVETRNDTLSYVWSKLYLKTVTDYYIANKTKKSKELLVIMDKRVDSLRSALYYTQGKLANYNDQNQQIIYQRARIIADRLQMNSSQLQSMYFEAVRNYDNLKFSLIKESPLFTIITDTELPLPFEPYRWGRVTIIGLLFGFFLSCFYLYLKQIYDHSKL
jgi:hypothetical protein